MTNVVTLPAPRPRLRLVRSVNLTERVVIALGDDIPLCRVVNALNAVGLSLSNLPGESLPVIVPTEYRP